MSKVAVKILLVEDNATDAELTLRALRRHNLANNVVVARDGAEALAFFFGGDELAQQGTTAQPKLVMLDLKLPKVNGHEVLRQLKASERTRHIPVVVLTSSREEQDILDSYHYGVNSYIVKPVDFDKFIDAVGELGLYWLLLNESPAPGAEPR